MKLFKITFCAFVATIVLSTINVQAINTWFFSGLVMSGHSIRYNSSKQVKDRESPQYFRHLNAYDTSTGKAREIAVQVVNDDTSVVSSTKITNIGDLVSWDEKSVKYDGTYHLRLWTTNILSNSVSLNATWYLDNTGL